MKLQEKNVIFFGACKTTSSSSDQSTVRPKLNMYPVTVRMELVPSSWRRRELLEVPFSAQMGVGPEDACLETALAAFGKGVESALCQSNLGFPMQQQNGAENSREKSAPPRG